MFHLVNPPDLPISLLLADDSAVWRIVRTQLAGIGAMKSNLCVVFTMATALSLAACDGKPEKSVPVGQVIASVDGMEITQRDLVAEMDMIGPAEENPERAREAALQQKIGRAQVAKEARTRELDDSPDFEIGRAHV